MGVWFLVTVASAVAQEPNPPATPPFIVRDGIGNVLQKLKQGGTVSVAYFGGSITAGEGWRVMTTKWLRTNYPKAQIEEVMASIGGTGSDLGVFRVGHDVLRFQPDLVFVEFAVNDSGSEARAIECCMEGIVRQIWKANPRTDIVFAYTFKTDFTAEVEAGKNPRSITAMEKIADHYGIPTVFFTWPLAELKKAGKLTFQAEKAEPGKILFSGDGVHPHTAGHELYAQWIREAFAGMAKSVPLNHSERLAKPPVRGDLENARQTFITPDMLKGRWRRMGTNEAPNVWYSPRMGQLWESDTPGDKLLFKFKGTQAKVYDISGPDTGQVIVRVNGKDLYGKPQPRFNPWCNGYNMTCLWCGGGYDPKQVTTVEIEIHPNQPDRTPIAYMFTNAVEELKKAKYQGRKIQVGSILLDGEVVTE